MKSCVAAALVLLCAWWQQEGAQACSCSGLHPQQAFCYSDVVMKAKVVGVTVDGELPGYIKYDINQTKMYKGPNKNFDAIYTASDSAMCGVELNNGTEYFIMGRLRSNGSLHINLCSFLSVPWEITKAMQKKSVLQQYQMGCGCTITRCSSVPCGISGPAECLWTDYLTEKKTFGEQARHFACIKRGDGSCAWYRGNASPKKEFMDIEDP
ncbi:metalloproteinase inhibitor 2-like [Corythoichthys intestinalis]|uniref:metalloproteinase inhibitor 2-like n=1 Tax=Corythoichthys intestinalis TaxID=161448 RepID=UPI0025A5BDC2|nr:metalloproteinase inhibitor 2-like [Corythoichthys intestinalis]XP_061805711.1 metalloproteinase inhibitor 2-like [Nerophis lumbriciformis]